MDKQFHIELNPNVRRIFWFAVGFYVGSNYNLERPILVRKEGK